MNIPYKKEIGPKGELLNDIAKMPNRTYLNLFPNRRKRKQEAKPIDYRWRDGMLKVVGNGKFRLRLQLVPDIENNKSKKVWHWDLK